MGKFLNAEIVKQRMDSRRTCSFCGKQYGPKDYKDFGRWRRSVCCSPECARNTIGKPLLRKYFKK